MANVSFESFPASAWANNQSGHYYSTPLIPWFRANGQPSEYPNEFVPDIGNRITFSQNVDPSAYNYIYNKTDPFGLKKVTLTKDLAYKVLMFLHIVNLIIGYLEVKDTGYRALFLNP